MNLPELFLLSLMVVLFVGAYSLGGWPLLLVVVASWCWVCHRWAVRLQGRRP